MAENKKCICNKKYCAKMSGKIFLNAILAGMFIGIAGTVYLSLLSKGSGIVGAVMFGFGLMTILCYGFKLFTGAIGYLVNQGADTICYLWQLLLIWSGNLLGTWLVGTLVHNSRSYSEAFAATASNVCMAKLNDGLVSIFILAFFCGILMYVAVESYRREELHSNFRIASVFFCVSVFILCGFEHCIANMYYFSVAALWSWKTLGYVLVMTLGNAVGGMMIPTADKLRK